MQHASETRSQTAITPPPPPLCEMVGSLNTIQGGQTAPMLRALSQEAIK